MSRPSLTVAICTRNRPIDLDRTLRSVMWQSEPATHVLVVDDSDVDQRACMRSLCERIDSSIEIVAKDTPGLTLSRNLAIERVTTDVLLFLDDDVVLHPRYVERMIDAFEADADLAGAGGSIDDDHRYGARWLRAALMIPGRDTGRVYRSGWSSQSPRHTTKQVQHLIGCNMAYRVSLIVDRRFADEFKGYALGEDLEFSHRLHLDGHRLMSVADAHLWHISDLPRHDRAWGYREVAIRPLVAGTRFNRLAFTLSASAFALVNGVRNRERARGNLAAIGDVWRRRTDASTQTQHKSEPGGRTETGS